jgi:translation initiation factor IF-1
LSKKDVIQVDGKISECLPGGKFKVRVAESHEIICHLSGKMRINSIKLLLGDTVTVEMSSSDTTKGRITYRK